MKKYFALPLSVALVASAIPPQAEAASLKDIKGHPYEASIQALVNEGVITGYPDQTYKPEQALTRWDVVVLLGRYLERQGYPVPSDYKTNMRFTDLNPKSGDMLLKYAAIVKDNEVFLGGNGKLLHKELLSHHHAALVLVRMVSKLAGTNFAMHDEEDFFLDIQNLQEQDRKAISLFAQLDLVSGQYFNPSTATTRGEFAHFLHGVRKLTDLSELKVESVQVLSSSHLFVTFTDGRTHDVNLSYRLPKNVNSTIRFTAYGKQFEQTVKMIVDDEFIVESVSNPNAAQFQIQFSKPVNLSNNFTSLDIKKIVQLTPRDAQGAPDLLSGELSPDKKTLTVTISGSYILNKRFYLQLNGVHSEDGATLIYTKEPVEFVDDKTKPEILYVEQQSLNQSLVKFSEPVDATYSRIYKLADGQIVTNVLSSISNDRTGITFDLTHAKVDGKSLDKNKDVFIELLTLKDRKDNITSNVKVAIRKSEQFNDKVAPELVSIEQHGAKMVKLTFTEPMSLESLYNVRVIENGINYVDFVEQDPTNPNAYILTMENFLRGNSTVTTRAGRYVFDLAENNLTFNKPFLFQYNTAEPIVLNTEVRREDNNEYLYLYFDKSVELTMNSSLAVNGTYTVNNQKMNIQTPIPAMLLPVEGNKKAARVLLSELLRGIDRDDANYSVSIELNSVKNDYGIAMQTPVTAQFTRTKDFNYNTNKLKVVSVDTSRTNASIKNSNLIIVNFNHAVDIATATDLKNYDLDRFVFEKVNVNPANPKQVELYINPNSITSPTSKELSIDDVRAMGSVYPMESYSEEVYINENVRPKLNMYSSTSYIAGYVTIYEENALTSPKEITLTYDEALAQVPSDLFIVKNADGDIIESETSLHAQDSRKVVIKFEQNLQRNKVVTIQFKPNRQLTDLYYNEADRMPFKFTVPFY
jgi:hypothetical protein